MLVTFGPNVSNLPAPHSGGLLNGVRKSAICMVKNLNKTPVIYSGGNSIDQFIGNLFVHLEKFCEYCR